MKQVKLEYFLEKEILLKWAIDHAAQIWPRHFQIHSRCKAMQLPYLNKLAGYTMRYLRQNYQTAEVKQMKKLHAYYQKTEENLLSDVDVGCNVLQIYFDKLQEHMVSFVNILPMSAFMVNRFISMGHFHLYEYFITCNVPTSRDIVKFCIHECCNNDAGIYIDLLYKPNVFGNYLNPLPQITLNDIRWILSHLDMFLENSANNEELTIDNAKVSNNNIWSKVSQLLDAAASSQAMDNCLQQLDPATVVKILTADNLNDEEKQVTGTIHPNEQPWRIIADNDSGHFNSRLAREDNSLQEEYESCLHYEEMEKVYSDEGFESEEEDEDEDEEIDEEEIEV